MSMVHSSSFVTDVYNYVALCLWQWVNYGTNLIFQVCKHISLFGIRRAKLSVTVYEIFSHKYTKQKRIEIKIYMLNRLVKMKHVDRKHLSDPLPIGIR